MAVAIRAVSVVVVNDWISPERPAHPVGRRAGERNKLALVVIRAQLTQILTGRNDAPTGQLSVSLKLLYEPVAA